MTVHGGQILGTKVTPPVVGTEAEIMAAISVAATQVTCLRGRVHRVGVILNKVRTTTTDSGETRPEVACNSIMDRLLGNNADTEALLEELGVLLDELEGYI